MISRALRNAWPLARFHALRTKGVVDRPVWHGYWTDLQQRCGGHKKFPAQEEFLESATEVYRFLQEEVMAAKNLRNVEDLCHEELWSTVHSVVDLHEPVRRQFGDDSRIIWTSTDAFVCGIGVFDEGEIEGMGRSVLIAMRFFSVIDLKYAPGEVHYAIDELDLVSEWDAEVGIKEWKIARLDGFLQHLSHPIKVE
mmetsp:Transcript_75632/g.142605  ORF Transcript_75632/g.142605 Transcript_75632/m.142605 type:complete len:196 (+) Transcript_75632:2-589(+)